MEIDWCCTKKGTAAVDFDLELLEWVKQYLLKRTNLQRNGCATNTNDLRTKMFQADIAEMTAHHAQECLAHLCELGRNFEHNCEMKLTLSVWVWGRTEVRRGPWP